MQAFYFDTVESTNDLAKSMLRDGRLRGPAFVVAREQTMGRGTRGRSWLSPRDAGIYLTVVDQPQIGATDHLPQFTRAAGIACVEVLAAHAGVGAKLRPINDLYVDGRKLGGILTEVVIERNEVRALLTGVGINVRNVVRDLPSDNVRPVSLEEVLPPTEFAELDVRGLTLHIVHAIRNWNAKLSEGGLATLEGPWKQYCLTTETAASHTARE